MKTKTLLILFLVMLSYIPGVFAIENSVISQQEEIVDVSAQGLCTVHIAYGNMHLTSHEFELALAEFEKGGMILEQSDQLLPELEFFISFGKVIAYDNLCLENKARAEIEHLVCLLRACEINEVADWEDSSSEEYSEVTESLKELAELSCTIDVREILLSIIDGMSIELIGFDKDYYYSIQSLNDDSDLMYKDLGFFKQAKKITKKIYKVCKIIMRVIELLEKLEEAITN